MDCVFHLMPDGRYQCSECGYSTVVEGLRKNCKGRRVPTIPPLTRRVYNFSLATIQHVCRGCPSRSQEEVDAIIEICRACELWIQHPTNPDIGICGHEKCGCTLTQQKRFLSKLGWASQSCPIEKW